MKSKHSLPRLAVPAVIGILFTGCLLKPATVSTRYFVLSPILTNEPALGPVSHLSVGIAFVKMPSYLLQNSMAVRNGANEIQYLDDARWAERLDQCFQSALAANLSRLLPSDNIYLSDWGRDQVMVRVSISVQQFEVDMRGIGTLVAEWRINTPNSLTTLRIGQTKLTRAGASPPGNPEAIATTLGELTAEFSRELVQLILESVKSSPRVQN